MKIIHLSSWWGENPNKKEPYADFLKGNNFHWLESGGAVAVVVEWWWARVSYFRFVSVGLQNARDCRAELSYAVYQQTGLNQPTYLVFADMLTQYLNNALWSSYVTQTTDRGSSGSHCSRAVLVTSSETRVTGVRVTVHFCLAIIIMVQPSSRHTISSHYTAWPQHTAHWTVIPNKQAEYAAPVCPAATPHSGDTRRMWRGRGPGSASRHCAIISGYTITSTNSG